MFCSLPFSNQLLKLSSSSDLGKARPSNIREQLFRKLEKVWLRYNATSIQVSQLLRVVAYTYKLTCGTYPSRKAFTIEFGVSILNVEELCTAILSS